MTTSLLSSTRTIRLGADIGGTKTEVVAIDQHNTVLHALRRPTGFGRDQVLATLFGLVRELLGNETLAERPIASLGIGIPGTVDTGSGTVANAVNVGLKDLAVAPLVEAELGLPASVENDVNAAAVGVHHLLGGGSADGTSAYLNLGTGLAAGFVSNGNLVRGATGAAGEIGHLPLDAVGGDACACGQSGCLELVASGSGIARQWPDNSLLPAASLFKAATDGDPLACAIQQRLFAGVATAVRVISLTFDPAVIHVGGGLNALGQPLLNGIRQELSRNSSSSAFMSGLALGQRVRLVPPGLPIGSVGAAICGNSN
ncbi:ROK family protein [Paenarthrobacter ilicis]|uniref:NBD/HSP70 family sugar kinase n=1 Tax=Paenarthrobacter ilicis TaxID=43665 RepID=A0ABX0TIY6_9MICC|nr:ROK family protein [Paenarthrobacter ilicis]MBM7794888.1 putative NBD/HSP70 family sugar kinase [Paenarthrobacter ilicis]NIJ02519.1 putative NBD/HSP70 family sugar kinase [Paenarthrobacter ilicis]